MAQITVEQAKALLTNLPTGVNINLRTTPRGNVILSTDTAATKEEIIKQQYGHLLGNNISLSEASELYDIPRATIGSWVYRSKYLEPTDTNSYPALFSQAEIAYLVDIYKERRAKKSKAPLLDDNGLPYHLKHPELARQRRQKKNESTD